jgi:hypothetical protein
MSLAHAKTAGGRPWQGNVTVMVLRPGGLDRAIDVDQLYFNVDALFELVYDDDRNAMMLAQAAGGGRLSCPP